VVRIHTRIWNVPSSNLTDVFRVCPESLLVNSGFISLFAYLFYGLHAVVSSWAMEWTMRGSNPARGKRFFHLQHVQTGSGVQSASTSMGTGVYINLMLFVFREIVLHTQVFLRLIAQLVLLLLRISAENHSHLQGATSV
jgi:hypothetical protein